jgi:hypothetical protein
LAHYTVDYSQLEDITSEAEDHLKHNEWSADKPHYEYDNVRIWDGGFGLAVIQDKESEKFYFDG